MRARGRRDGVFMTPWRYKFFFYFFFLSFFLYSDGKIIESQNVTNQRRLSLVRSQAHDYYYILQDMLGGSNSWHAHQVRENLKPSV